MHFRPPKTVIYFRYSHDRSPADIREFALVEAKINRFYGRKIGFARLMPYESWLNRIEKCDDRNRLRYFHATGLTCSTASSCHGLPFGSEFIAVTVPGFKHLDMFRVNGRMKIFRLFIFDD